jgi:transcriptional regulator with XRE-family HTH domain
VDKLVGANLRRIRIARNFTQQSLAAELEITFQQIQKYEKGINAVASSRIPRLCQVLRIVPSDLFDGSLDGQAETVMPMSVAAARMAAKINTISPKAQAIMAAVLEAVGGL